MATSLNSKLLEEAPKQWSKDYHTRTLVSINRHRVSQFLVKLVNWQWREVSRLAQSSAVGVAWLPQAPWNSMFQLVCHRLIVLHLQRPISTPWTTNWMLASLSRVSLWELQEENPGPTQSPTTSKRATAKIPRPLSLSSAKVMTVSASGNSTVILMQETFPSLPWTPSAAMVHYQTRLLSVLGTSVQMLTVPSAKKDGKAYLLPPRSKKLILRRNQTTASMLV